MAKLALNKSTLNKEGQKVKAFKRFVPALDLKRKQLLSARVAARQQLQAIEQRLQQVQQQVCEQLPMSSQTNAELLALIQVDVFTLKQVNLVGIVLPEIDTLRLSLRPYSYLGAEHWLYPLLHLLMLAVELQLQQRVWQKRLDCIDIGLRKTTQRLNLFEKVLIPQAQKNIQRIHIALSDTERAAVVSSKIAKKKRQNMGIA